MKSIGSILISLFLVLFMSSTLAVSQVPMSEILSQFTKYAEQMKSDSRVPGMAIAIVQNNKIIYLKGFGQRDAEGNPVTPDTVFDVASLTKSFTATLLAKQIDEGKYTWNTKVVKLYPQFKLYDPAATQQFEVWDLLAHDSGLPAGATDSLGSFGYSNPYMIYALRFIKPLAPFRTQFAYEGIFPVIAKEIIQNISNESYAVNLQQKLLKPLEMNNTYVVTEPEFTQLKNVAWPFINDDGNLYPYSKNYPYISEKWALKNGVGSGGIESSARDIAKWLIFNINNGAVGDTQLISSKNMNYIHSPHTVINTSSSDVKLVYNTQQSYGLGWFIDKAGYRPYTVLYHAGGGTGMHALMSYIPEEKIGIVILTNTWGNQVPEAVTKRFFDLYFNKKPLTVQNKPYATTDKKAQDQSDQCVAFKNLNLNKYIGIYYNPVYGNLKMVKINNYLQLTIGPRHITWRLTPCQNNVFKANWPNPGGMHFLMLPIGQDLIQFLQGQDHKIQKMVIPYLNSDGSGIFEKIR